jgi:hypothetical protein
MAAGCLMLLNKARQKKRPIASRPQAGSLPHNGGTGAGLSTLDIQFHRELQNSGVAGSGDPSEGCRGERRGWVAEIRVIDGVDIRECIDVFGAIQHVIVPLDCPPATEMVAEL